MTVYFPEVKKPIISAGQWNTSPIHGKVGSAVGLKSLSVIVRIQTPQKGPDKYCSVIELKYKGKLKAEKYDGSKK